MGIASGKPHRHGFCRNAVKAVLEQDGQLSKGLLLRCRVRYFSGGAKPIRQATAIGLVTLRDLRRQPISLPSG
jgi:hypothetical protein